MLAAIPIPVLLGLGAVAVIVLAICMPGALAIGALAFFVAIMAWHVPEPDLIICISVVVAMAAFDFAREWFQHRNGTAEGAADGDGAGGDSGEGGQ
ncbi:hypothetical protein LNKW23_18850 [Paralimibaculum aggregatum]|uniref:Uncharacterized protein n=1 Tax=Paralimibaculum aggregatum TaxID=3036245 RepID=A0ABQ6LLW2_9RHOB|nr:hypothetical protein [Limibaculum sp. NKW23]GMG82672.1 hypothetical protein LNKW23_18850 [Limibaculum sp. NKW23]